MEFDILAILTHLPIFTNKISKYKSKFFLCTLLVHTWISQSRLVYKLSTYYQKWFVLIDLWWILLNSWVKIKNMSWIIPLMYQNSIYILITGKQSKTIFEILLNLLLASIYGRLLIYVFLVVLSKAMKWLYLTFLSPKMLR